jgi:hypothetical protein
LPSGTFLLDSAHGFAGRLPGGQPIPTALLIDRPHVTVQGSGPGTVLLLGAHKKMRAVTVTASHVILSGLTVDGNKRLQSAQVPYPAGDVVDTLVSGWQTHDVLLRDCVVRDSAEDGIGFWRSAHVRVTGCRVIGAGTVQSGGAGIALSGGEDEVADHDVARGNSGPGVWIAYRSVRSTVSSDTLSSNRKGGVVVNGDHVTIQGNVISGNGSGGFAGVTVAAGTDGLVAGNTVVGNAVAGIRVGESRGVVRGWQIRQNVCRNNGRGLDQQIVVTPSDALPSDWRRANTLSFDRRAGVMDRGGWLVQSAVVFAVAACSMLAALVIARHRSRGASQKRI